jgi:cobalt/nickel transport system ATP-binding protein
MVERLILDLKNRFGISIVIATHDLDLAARIADRICLVREGSVFAEGPPDEIFYDSELLQENGLRPPQIVQVYRAYCRTMGIQNDRHPLTIDAMMEVIGSNSVARKGDS